MTDQQIWQHLIFLFRIEHRQLAISRSTFIQQVWSDSPINLAASLYQLIGAALRIKQLVRCSTVGELYDEIVESFLRHDMLAVNPKPLFEALYDPCAPQTR